MSPLKGSRAASVLAVGALLIGSLLCSACDRSTPSIVGSYNDACTTLLRGEAGHDLGEPILTIEPVVRPATPDYSRIVGCVYYLRKIPLEGPTALAIQIFPAPGLVEPTFAAAARGYVEARPGTVERPVAGIGRRAFAVLGDRTQGLLVDTGSGVVLVSVVEAGPSPGAIPTLREAAGQVLPRLPTPPDENVSERFDASTLRPTTAIEVLLNSSDAAGP